MAWLDKSAAPTILRELTGQPLTHTALDTLPAGKTVEHLRSILVAIGTLPPRDEQMARLERWITSVVADRCDPDERGMLHRYAVWHVLRRLRGRLKGARAKHSVGGRYGGRPSKPERGNGPGQRGSDRVRRDRPRWFDHVSVNRVMLDR